VVVVVVVVVLERRGNCVVVVVLWVSFCGTRDDTGGARLVFTDDGAAEGVVADVALILFCLSQRRGIIFFVFLCLCEKI
jgi:hypothetical protein